MFVLTEVCQFDRDSTKLTIMRSSYYYEWTQNVCVWKYEISIWSKL